MAFHWQVSRTTLLRLEQSGTQGAHGSGLVAPPLACLTATLLAPRALALALGDRKIPPSSLAYKLFIPYPDFYMDELVQL